MSAQEIQLEQQPDLKQQSPKGEPMLSRRAALVAAGVGGAILAAPATAAAAATDPVPAAVPTPAPDGGPLHVSRSVFGRTKAGETVHRFVFGNAALTVSMITYGAAIQRIEVPDRSEHVDDVALGEPTVAAYEALTTYFGATIGRYANRIAKGTFVLDGVRYQIPINNGVNALHGGPTGFSTRVWKAAAIRSPGAVGVRFTYVSAAGEDGFPGKLTTTVRYTVNRTGALTIRYHATTNAPTVLNLTNHAYFNLLGAGKGDIYDHLVTLEADQYTPIDATSIPLGPQAQVAGTPFDFRTPHTIGSRIRVATRQIRNAHGYDHNWVLRGPHGKSPRLAAVVRESTTGRSLECFTDQPGVQFYTSNFLDGTNIGLGDRAYRQGDAFTLETQHYPDSPNHPAYPSTVLRPGKVFTSTTTFGFTAS